VADPQLDMWEAAAERKAREPQEEVPQNWCDPLLTGPAAVIGKPPYDCRGSAA